MKKNLMKFITAGIICLILGISNYHTYWENIYSPDFPFDNTNVRTHNPSDNCTWNCTNLYDDVDITNNNSIINRLLGVFGLDNEDTLWPTHKFINYARAILNMALWLLSLIALVMTIYTFYLMFFTENEAWIKKAKWNLVGIFIALAIIGLAWLIVSFIFRWYQNKWQNAL